mgnify:CR=1 FL=1
MLSAIPIRQPEILEALGVGDRLLLGDGNVDLRLRGIAQYQVGAFWAALETGYDKRNGAPQDKLELCPFPDNSAYFPSASSPAPPPLSSSSPPPFSSLRDRPAADVAVARVAGRTRLEVSGGVTRERMAELATTEQDEYVSLTQYATTATKLHPLTADLSAIEQAFANSSRNRF